MNYVGNFANWIQQSWIDEVLAKEGWTVPRDLSKDPQLKLNEDEQEWFKSGYKMSDHFFSAFYKDDCSFNIEAPFSPQSWDWWIVKMMPGQFIPIHGDLAMATRKAAKSYWMPWQDWEPGHIFMFGDQTSVHYKKGDVFEYDASIKHCAANVGLTPRIVLQIREYEQ